MATTNYTELLKYFGSQLTGQYSDPDSLGIGYDPELGWNAFEAAGSPGGDYNSWLGQKYLERNAQGMSPEAYAQKMIDTIYPKFSQAGGPFDDGSGRVILDNDGNPINYSGWGDSPDRPSVVQGSDGQYYVTTRSHDDEFDPGNAVMAALVAAGTAGVGSWAAAGGLGAGGAAGLPFGENAILAGQGASAGAGAAAGAGGGMWDYGDFLQSIGIDPSSTQFAGGTLSNADIMSQIYGGASGLPPTVTDLLKNGGTQLLKALGSGSGSGIGGLLGALLGGAAGGVGANSKPAGTTTTVQDVPDWLKPYLIGNLNSAAGTQAGLLTTPGATPPALAEYLKTINGDYLNPGTNPYLDATYKHAADLVGAGVDSRFESAGRYGSGAHQGVLQEGMNNLATGIYGGNYQAERARQASAVSGAPAFDAGRSTAAYSPYSGFADLFPASARATTSPYFTNTAGGILSGALAGSQLSKLFPT